MANYHICAEIIQLSTYRHSVIVSAVPGKGEISALGVVVLMAEAANEKLACMERDRLLAEIRAKVLANGDSIAAEAPRETTRPAASLQSPKREIDLLLRR